MTNQNNDSKICFLTDHKIVWVGDRYECWKCKLVFKPEQAKEQL